MTSLPEGLLVLDLLCDREGVGSTNLPDLGPLVFVPQ